MYNYLKMLQYISQRWDGLWIPPIYWTPLSDMLQETQELQQKQQWYQKNQLTMTKEDEDQYLAYCSDTMFRIHVLKLRLSRYGLIAQWINLLKTQSGRQKSYCTVLNCILQNDSPAGFPFNFIHI